MDDIKKVTTNLRNLLASQECFSCSDPSAPIVTNFPRPDSPPRKLCRACYAGTELGRRDLWELAYATSGVGHAPCPIDPPRLSDLTDGFLASDPQHMLWLKWWVYNSRPREYSQVPQIAAMLDGTNERAHGRGATWRGLMSILFPKPLEDDDANPS